MTMDRQTIRHKRRCYDMVEIGKVNVGELRLLRTAAERSLRQGFEEAGGS